MKTFPSSNFRIGLFLTGAISLAACNAAPQQGLDSVVVPEGFTFRASQPVSISVSANASLGLGQATALQLRTPDEQVLFQGSIATAAPVALQLGVATRHDHLIAVLSPGTADERRFSMPIQVANGSAAGTLELQ